MIIWVVTFPENFHPRKIAFKTHSQAVKICEIFKLKKKDLTCLVLEEDETRIPFHDYQPSVLAQTKENEEV